MLEADKVTLKNYYTERGYIDAAVTEVRRTVDAETNPEKNLVSLTFVISEGDQYIYGGTELEGNTIFDTATLLSNIRLNEGDVMNQGRYDVGRITSYNVCYTKLLRENPLGFTLRISTVFEIHSR